MLQHCSHHHCLISPGQPLQLGSHSACTLMHCFTGSAKPYRVQQGS